MSCDVLCVVHIVTYIYEIISIPFYISVIVILFLKRKNELNSSFFHFCISLGVADVVALLSRIFFLNIPITIHQYYPKARTTIEHVVFQTASSIIQAWGTYFVQVCGIFLLCFNRLTAVWNPFEYELWWTRKKMIFAIVLQWLCIFPFSLPQLHPCCRSKMSNNITYRPVMENYDVKVIFYTIDIVLESFICSPLLIIMWLIIIVKYSQQSNQVVPFGQQNSIQALDKRCAIIGIILCLLYLYLAMTWVVYLVNDGYINRFQAAITLIVADLFTCSNPYLLLIFSSVFRSCYVPFITFGKIHV